MIILWDGIFENNYNLNLVEWVCVAMLVAIKNLRIISLYTNILVVIADYSESLTLLMHYPCLSDIGMTMQDLLESAKRLKAIYESKTYTISTTPTIMDNLDKTIVSYSNKTFSAKLASLGNRPKLDALNELENYKQQARVLQHNNSALDRRLSKVKKRDFQIINALNTVIQNLESLRKEEDRDLIEKSIGHQCGSLKELVETLEHFSLDLSESTQTLGEIEEVKTQKLDRMDMDNSTGNIVGKATNVIRTSVSRVIFGGPETAKNSIAVIKMQPKTSSSNSSNDTPSLPDKLCLEQDPLGV